MKFITHSLHPLSPGSASASPHCLATLVTATDCPSPKRVTVLGRWCPLGRVEGLSSGATQAAAIEVDFEP
jgi:hypothetical protein